MSFSLTLALLAVIQGPTTAPDTLSVLLPTRYELDIKVDIPNRQLIGSARVTLKNTGSNPVSNASFLLYRLMRATAARDSAGTQLRFTQPVVEFSDHATLQVRQVSVALLRPLPPGQSTLVHIDYSGALLGYSETGMMYVRDRIDTAYTLIRDDAFAFPYPGVPSHRANRMAGHRSYDYRARIKVPEGFTVANGGELVGKTSTGTWTTFEYRNIKPAWRMDFGVARFTVRDGAGIRVFHLPEDSAGGARIVQAMNETLDTYTRWFGPMRVTSRFTLIEIPDGWGSQADVTSILQAAAAFRNPKRQYELYHELSHLWNVKLKDLPSPRWDEGLATFLEDVTADSIEKRSSTDSSAERLADWLKGMTKKDEMLTRTPMMEYGRAEMTGYSYSVGALMFYTVYRLMGHQAFVRLIGEYYRRYEATGGSTDEFVLLAKKLSPVSLEKVFDDWLYSARWVDVIAVTPGSALAERYRSSAK